MKLAGTEKEGPHLWTKRLPSYPYNIFPLLFIFNRKELTQCQYKNTITNKIIIFYRI